MEDFQRIEFKDSSSIDGAAVTIKKSRAKPGPKKSANTRSEKESCRLTKAEAAAFRRVCKARRIRPADYLRECCLAAVYLPKSFEKTSMIADAFHKLHELEARASQKEEALNLAGDSEGAEDAATMKKIVVGIRKRLKGALMVGVVAVSGFALEADAQVRLTLRMILEQAKDYFISHSVLNLTITIFVGLWIWSFVLAFVKRDIQRKEAIKDHITVSVKSAKERAMLLQQLDRVIFFGGVCRKLGFLVIYMAAAVPLARVVYELMNWQSTEQAFLQSNPTLMKQAAYDFGYAVVPVGMALSLLLLLSFNKIRAMLANIKAQQLKKDRNHKV